MKSLLYFIPILFITILVIFPKLIYPFISNEFLVGGFFIWFLLVLIIDDQVRRNFASAFMKIEDEKEQVDILNVKKTSKKSWESNPNKTI